MKEHRHSDQEPRTASELKSITALLIAVQAELGVTAPIFVNEVSKEFLAEQRANQRIFARRRAHGRLSHRADWK